MKEVISIYKKHKTTVDEFIITMIKNLPKNYIENAHEILKNHPNIQLLYAVDNQYKQISPIICKKRRSTDISKEKLNIAKRISNPNLMLIHFYAFRHWKATTEKYKTKDR